jgi:NADPH2 dehydrogenase
MAVSSPSPALFTPIKVGNVDLKHRVVMAPLTRFRAIDHVPNNLVALHYEQRASRPGTLMLTEATLISAKAGGYDDAPGIWSDAQVEGWSKVFQRIHRKGSAVFVQLWALGRQADPKVMEKEGLPFVSASEVPVEKGAKVPQSLTRDEIKEYIQDYVHAAKNAIAAGADGVEIHSAHGYLLDQFLHENTNLRTDEYGGSIENRARFTLEVVDALIDAVGADRVSVRISPWSTFGNVTYDVSPLSQWAYVTAELEKRAQQGNRLAYIHIVEPRVNGHEDTDRIGVSNQFVREIWQGKLIRACAIIDAEQEAEKDPNSLIDLGRYFISNPDLVDRLEKKQKLTPYYKPTFYDSTEVGYTEYLGRANSLVAMSNHLSSRQGPQAYVRPQPPQSHPNYMCVCSSAAPRVPRPRNAFILFRQHQHSIVVRENPGKNNPEVSKIIGGQWRSLTQKDKDFWIQLADEEKRSHLERFPDYRYQPRRPCKRSRSTTHNHQSGLCPICKGVSVTSFNGHHTTPAAPETPGTPESTASRPTLIPPIYTIEQNFAIQQQQLPLGHPSKHIPGRQSAPHLSAYSHASQQVPVTGPRHQSAPESLHVPPMAYGFNIQHSVPDSSAAHSTSLSPASSVSSGYLPRIIPRLKDEVLPNSPQFKLRSVSSPVPENNQPPPQQPEERPWAYPQSLPPSPQYSKFHMYRRPMGLRRNSSFGSHTPSPVPLATLPEEDQQLKRRRTSSQYDSLASDCVGRHAKVSDTPKQCERLYQPSHEVQNFGICEKAEVLSTICAPLRQEPRHKLIAIEGKDPKLVSTIMAKLKARLDLADCKYGDALFDRAPGFLQSKTAINMFKFSCLHQIVSELSPSTKFTLVGGYLLAVADELAYQGDDGSPGMPYKERWMINANMLRGLPRPDYLIALQTTAGEEMSVIQLNGGSTLLLVTVDGQIHYEPISAHITRIVDQVVRIVGG